MRTALTGRTHGRTDQRCNVKLRLANPEPSTHANPEPSTHGTSATSPDKQRMVAFWHHPGRAGPLVSRSAYWGSAVF